MEESIYSKIEQFDEIAKKLPVFGISDRNNISLLKHLYVELDTTTSKVIGELYDDCMRLRQELDDVNGVIR